jgi:hypothetical protein
MDDNLLPGNPHYRAACDEAWPQARALQATLALAFEQRTANLIASLQSVKLSDGRVLAPDLETAAKAMRQIAERLDLEVGGAVE